MQIIADELDVQLRQVTLIQGDTVLAPDQGATNSSLAIRAPVAVNVHAAWFNAPSGQRPLA